LLTLWLVLLLSTSKLVRIDIISAAASLLLFIGILLWTTRSLAGRGANFDQHLAIGSTSLRAAHPTPLADGFAFTSMQLGGYRLRLVQDGIPWPLTVPGDALSVATNPAFNLIYVESSEETSKIIRFRRPGGSSELVTEGESPSLSPQADRIAFLREELGRGELWIRELNDGREELLTGRSFDVLDATFSPPGEIWMSARLNGSPPALFRVDAVARTLPNRFSDVGWHVRSVAISPSGEKLAFSRNEGGSWHLFVRILNSGKEFPIAVGPCNSTDPSWNGDGKLRYATDCGRGLGLSALAQATVP
jgi:hypothetical protein